TKGNLASSSKLYHILNLTGGAGIVVEAISNGAYPPAALNVAWGVIAVYGILRLMRSDGSRKAGTGPVTKVGGYRSNKTDPNLG
ncbi:MAG TPA: hypothetical protein VNW25_05750, partial [Candidatus Sulfotelmatobacter sp.]|nr:hypothetical protein [Candidatus Sulfotelmatobacter sp.]